MSMNGAKAGPGSLRCAQRVENVPQGRRDARTPSADGLKTCGENPQGELPGTEEGRDRSVGGRWWRR